MESYKNSDVVSQRLLEPVVLNLDSGLKIVLENHLALMESFGFMIDSLDDKYVLTGIPFVMRGITTWSFFNELLDKLSDIPRQVTGLYEEKLEQIAVIACKAAVKGNERLDFAEAKSLIEQILKLENPFTCPHGRPTVIRMSKYEIEKMFKRVQ
jgi:DNA mismatch repair protein MutL